VPYRALRHGEELDLPLLRTSQASLGDAVHILLAMKRESASRYEHLSELMGEGGSWRLNFERGQSWLLPVGSIGDQRMRELIVLMQQKRWRGGNWRVDARLPTRWFIRKSKMGGMV